MNKALRRTIIAGNWKMNNTRASTAKLLDELVPLVSDADCDIIAFVPFTGLHTALAASAGSNILIGAQNCHWAKSGAFTGEISADMLLDAGVRYVLIGHSERRQYFSETDTTVNWRLHAALDSGLTAILCVGELGEQRDRGITQEILSMQLKIALSDVPKQSLPKIILAYEPVWAIGTGETATAAHAGAACAYIRSVLAQLYDVAAADATSILYGGSMNAANAQELLAQPDIDGGLIGGAALCAENFAKIVHAAR